MTDSDFLLTRIDYDQKRLNTLYERLDSFKELKAGWNSYGASAIDLKIIDVSKLILDILFGVTQGGPIYTFPTASGGVQFELFHNACELELEINGEKNVELLYDDKSKGYMYTFDIVLKEVFTYPVTFTKSEESTESVTNERNEFGDEKGNL